MLSFYITASDSKINHSSDLVSYCEKLVQNKKIEQYPQLRMLKENEVYLVFSENYLQIGIFRKDTSEVTYFWTQEELQCEIAKARANNITIENIKDIKAIIAKYAEEKYGILQSYLNNFPKSWLTLDIIPNLRPKNHTIELVNNWAEKVLDGPQHPKEIAKIEQGIVLERKKRQFIIAGTGIMCLIAVMCLIAASCALFRNFKKKNKITDQDNNIEDNNLNIDKEDKDKDNNIEIIDNVISDEIMLE